MKKGNAKPTVGKSDAKVTPLGDRVLLKPETKEDKKSLSGIIIPDTVDKEKPETGKVIAVGEGKYEDGKLIPMRIKVGQTVMFSKYGYDEEKVDGKDYFIVREDNILAILK
jgi:chaperonin GroES